MVLPQRLMAPFASAVPKASAPSLAAVWAHRAPFTATYNSGGGGPLKGLKPPLLLEVSPGLPASPEPWRVPCFLRPSSRHPCNPPRRSRLHAGRARPRHAGGSPRSIPHRARGAPSRRAASSCAGHIPPVIDPRCLPSPPQLHLRFLRPLWLPLPFQHQQLALGWGPFFYRNNHMEKVTDFVGGKWGVASPLGLKFRGWVSVGLPGQPDAPLVSSQCDR